MERTMERRIVILAPANGGWRIDVPDQAARVMTDMHAALAEAWRLARDAHMSTGAPTAVKVKMGCGDGVMIGYNG
jgi:hypothetical protein